MLSNQEAMDTLSTLLSRDDESAIATIRGQQTAHSHCLEAQAVLQHNERFRQWFRSASMNGDPFDHTR